MSSLFVADFSSIEARVLAWLAGQDHTLKLFRQGKDLYCAEATKTFGRNITKADKYERSVGKVEVLALGYQGGVGAFGAMAKGYGVDLRPAYDNMWPFATEEEQVKARRAYDFYIKRTEDIDPLDIKSGHAADLIKQRWRAANPEITKLWRDIETAAKTAVSTKEPQIIGDTDMHEFTDTHQKITSISRPTIKFGTKGSYLLCKLPSGTCLVYPFPRLSGKTTPWGEEKKVVTYRHDENGMFIRTHTYGGKLVENIVQAIARDLLAEAMIRIDEAGYDIVLHVHDEVVADVPQGFGSVKEYARLMSEVPEWAEGLPLDVDAWKGARYRK